MQRAEREQFVQWLRESYIHVTEMLRIAQIHGELKHFEHWARISTGPKTDEDKIVQLPGTPEEDSQGSQPHPPRSPPQARRMGHGLRLVAIAATVLVVVGTVIVVLPRVRGQVIETERGERREVVLGDGSVLQVDSETRLRVKYAEEARQVFLERGRALFHVTKNPNRPFLVQADGTTVRAVGTAFGVEREAQGVVVTVTEGKVAVSSSGFQVPQSGSGEITAQREGEHRGLYLTADQQVTVPSRGAPEAVRDVDSHLALAWAEGRLIFQNDELGKVIAAFNRYNRVQLRVTDSGLAAKPVSGVFNASDPEAFIAFLQSVTAVEIVRDGDRSITIGAARPR
jgi:transmembrane sensor